MGVLPSNGRVEERIHLINLNAYNGVTVAKNLIESVVALPIAERLELLDRLRESVRNDPALAPLTDKEKHVLDKCLDDFELDPSEGSTWAQVESRIRTALGRR